MSRVRRIAAAAAAAGALALLALGTPAWADASTPVATPLTGSLSVTGGSPDLSIAPASGLGRFFSVINEPGSTRTLQFDVANHGDASAPARVYVAEAYSMVNGGMGVRLHGEAAGGVAAWLTAEPWEGTIPARTSIHRSLQLTVPKGTAAGEYVAAVVTESTEAPRAGGSVGVVQVTRHAIAVSVRVPGPLVGSAAVAAASHANVAGRSVVAVGIENTGNRILKPTVALALHDAAGKEIAATTVAMDSVYAHTTTTVEMPLAELLPPGDYSITASLADASRGVPSVSRTVPLHVAALDGPSSDATQRPQVVTVDTAAGAGSPSFPLGLVVGGAAGLGVLLVLVGLWLRRRAAVAAPRRARRKRV
ncbi:MAG: hypothetical protein JWM93_3809, partial [Frankiales bacterium]|nr:hypothetical protein [Frankiales bacterium]